MAKGWTEERRKKQAEMTRRQMACPARRELQRQIMTRLRKTADMEEARRKKTYTPEWRERQSAALIEVRSDPVVEKRRKEGARKAVKARLAKIRGGVVPAGYEAEYEKLRKSKKIPAAESLRIVRAQRGADLRSS